MDLVNPHHSSLFGRLRGLLEATRLVRAEGDLPTLLDEIARTIAESLGFSTVAINLYRPAWDAFEVTAVHGSERARRALLGETRRREAWRPLLDERFETRGAYLIPQGDYDWATGELAHHIPDLDEPRFDNAWRPEDALLVPLRSGDGELLGIVSVDEPSSGRRPGADELDVLVAVAEHAALALESAQAAARAESHRAALERLLAVSSSLTETRQLGQALLLVCEAIRDALGFGTVSVELHDPTTGVYTTGVRIGTEVAAVPFSEQELAQLVAPAFEVEGCYLLPDDEARRRIGDRETHRSQQNGAGPHAWDHHWLLVPLVAHGRSIGFLWVDDPADRLLPSRDRLQVLRAFANHAATALDAATQFAALHGSEARTTAVLRTALDAVVILDHDGRVVAANPAAEETFGWTSDEALGRDFVDLAIPERNRADVAAMVAAGVGPLLDKRLEIEAARADGREFPAEVVLTRVELPGAPVFAAWVRDVSRAKARDEELREAAAKYRTLVEGLPLVTYVNDLGLPVRTRWMSPQIEQLLGFPAEDWLREGFFLERIHPDDRPWVLAEVERTHETGEPFRAEYRLLHRDGRVVRVRDETIAARDEEYRPLFLQGFLVDVGEEARTAPPPLRAVS